MRSSSAITSCASSTSWCSIASRVRSKRAVDEVEAAEAARLEPFQLLLVLAARLQRHQPNFPVTYCSVRSSSGLVKIVVGGADLDQLAVRA